jgi:hypothetical protein
MWIILTMGLAASAQTSSTSLGNGVRNASLPQQAPIFSERAAPSLPFAPALFGRGVAAADLDQDGRQDFVIATATGAAVYMNRGAAGFVDETVQRLPLAVQGGLPAANLPVIADVDGDGWPDVVLLVEGGLGADLLLRNSGAGVLGAPQSLPSVTSVSSDAEFVDVDGDGDLDLVRSVGSSGHVNDAGRDSLALNDGSGQFTASPTFAQAVWNSESIPSTGVTVLDANNDFRADLFITRADAGAATGTPGAKNLLLYGDGSGGFFDGSAGLPDLDDNSFDAVPIDLDADGDMDLVVCNSVLGVSGANSGDVLVNQGGAQGGARGTFHDRPGSIDETPILAESIRLGLLSADVNRDGQDDVLFRVHDLPPGGEQPLFLGAGLDFSRATNFDTDTFIAAGGAFADIDGDGDPDLLLTSSGSAGGGSPLGHARLFLNVSR